MSTRITQEKRTVTAAIATLMTFAVLVALGYRFQHIEISSAEVDDILYARLAEYNRSILEDPGVETIFMTAETNPDELSEEQRVIYLAYQRAFLDSWEAALNYNDAGLFDANRWSIWNTWFIEEIRRRPTFGWTENRQYYGGAFLRYVDESLDEFTLASADEEN